MRIDMNCSILLRGPFVLLFVCLFLGVGWGADIKKVDCRAEAESLRTNEAEMCSDFGYLFNPSACIRARKALDSYTAGECRQPAAELPQLQALPAVHPVESAPPATVVSNPAPVAGSLPKPGKTSAVAAVSESETEQLRREITALRAEVQQLSREVATLRAQQK
jgi:hypothetical protein